MIFQDHLSQQQGIFWLGDSYPMAYHSTQTLHNFKCSIEETVIPQCNKGWAYSIFVKIIDEILKREQVVYRCMAK